MTLCETTLSAYASGNLSSYAIGSSAAMNEELGFSTVRFLPSSSLSLPLLLIQPPLHYMPARLHSLLLSRYRWPEHSGSSRMRLASPSPLSCSLHSLRSLAELPCVSDPVSSLLVC
jgi:hypothetical protein